MPYNTFADIVRVPYSTRPNFEGYDGPLIKKPMSEIHLAAKQQLTLMEKKEGKISWFDSEIDVPWPTLLEQIGSRLRIHRDDPFRSICDIGMQIQEDIAVMKDGRLIAAHIMFPSGWAPETKRGKSFAELHEPVANNGALLASAQSMIDTMCRITIHRYVWGLSYNPALSHHPKYEKESRGPDLHFRWEHQISFPLREMASCFLIDVRMKPFMEMSKFDRARILESVNSMTPEMLEYKKLTNIKEIMNHAATRDYAQRGKGGSRLHYGPKTTSFGLPQTTTFEIG